MRANNSSSSSTSRTASTTAAAKPSRRKPSRDQLRRWLKIVGNLSEPLPSDLPSPPASRSASPAPSLAGAKRKQEHPKASSETFKRPRIDSAASSSKTPGASNFDPTPSALSRDSEHPFVPLRRPRRAKGVSHDYVEQVNHRAFQQARLFKFSGEARYFSTHASSSQEYKPLPDKYEPSPAYRHHGSVISRLEYLEGLLLFSYHAWLREFGKSGCDVDKWKGIIEILKTTKFRWQGMDGEGERALFGLILSLESFINGRLSSALLKNSLNTDVFIYTSQFTAKAKQLIDAQPTANLRSHPTPPMLPSPAASMITSSANSTPTATASTSSPATALAVSDAPPVQPKGANFVPSELYAKMGVKSLPAAADAIRIEMNPQQVGNILNQVEWSNQVAARASDAQKLFNLPVLMRHFPRTFARVTNTTLHPDEEIEPDLDDDEGELFWPSQVHTGEGLGWLCLIGRSMAHEFGRQFEYQGIDGLIPRPDSSRSAAEPTPAQSARRS